MSYLAAQQGVSPLIMPEMSREISPKDAVTVWKLFCLMLRERPDLVHTHTAKAGTVGRVAGLMYRWLTPSTLVGRPRRCRFVHTYHGHVFHSYYGRTKTRLFLAIEKTLARLLTDRIVVITEQQRREINETFRVGSASQFAVIPLGIDLDIYANWQTRRDRLRRELKAADDEIWIGIVGRLTEIKNHEMFLQAANLLEQRRLRHRIKFVVIGDGHLRTQLERKTESLGLRDDVLFLGSRNDPENFYPALDVLALTSLNEGTPLSVIEAMANARPVIATSVGGVIDLLGRLNDQTADGFTVHERGISVASNDAEVFAKGLQHLIENPELRQELGERGRAFVGANYAKERLIADIAALYSELNPEAAPAGSVAPTEEFEGDYHVRLTPRS